MKRYILFFLCLGIGSIQAQVIDIKEFGAKGDGTSDDTKAIQQAIDQASKDKLHLRFPAGTYMTGMIHLKSNISIELQAGATWQAIPDLSLYPEIDSRADLSQTGWYTMSRRAFIFGDNVENVTLKGEGRIYPSGDHYEAFPNLEENGSKRPYGIYFRNSSNIKVEGLQLYKSAFWMFRAYLCEDVHLTGLDIFNHANTNNDGIDIVDCHRVRISDCTIDSADDAISLKTEAPKGCEDVVITNCIVSSTASYIKLGTGSFGSFKRIAVSNCVLRPTRADTLIHALKYQNGITGLSLMSVDGADIENISFSNIVMSGMLTPIFVRLGNRHRVTHEEYASHPITAGTIKNIAYDNITATDCGPLPINITGYPGHYVEGVRISDSSFSFGSAGSANDRDSAVPENSDSYPYPKMYGTDLPAFGFYGRHIDGIKWNNVDFYPAENEVRPPLVLEDVKGFDHKALYIQGKTASQQHIIKK